MLRLVFVIVLACHLDALVWADSLLPDSSAETSQQESLVAPQLTDLENQWWQYFAVANEPQRRKRVQIVIEQIKDLGVEASISKPITEVLQQWLASFTPPEEKKRKAFLSELKNQDSYSTKDILDLARALQEQEHYSNRLQQQIQQREQYMGDLRGTLRKLKLDYQETQGDSDKRLPMALEWVKLRFTQGTLENEQQSAQKQRASSETMRVAFVRQLEFAQEHFRPQVELEKRPLLTLKKLKDDITHKQGILAQRKLAHLKPRDDEAETLLQHQLEQSKLLIEEINLALQQLQADEQQINLYLYQLADESSRETFDYKGLRDYLQLHRGQQEAQKKQLPLWQKQYVDDLSLANTQAAEYEGKKGNHYKVLSSLNQQIIKELQKAPALLSQLESKQYDSDLLVGILVQHSHSAQGGARAAVTAVTDTAEDAFKFSWESLNSPLFEINDTPITAISMVRFIFILFIAWVISRALNGVLRRLGRIKGLKNQKQMDSGSSIFVIQRILFYAIMMIGFMIGLSSIGIDISKFALIASALSIGIGFGLQNMINNFVSGVIMLFEKSLKIGDFVELESGVLGEVREMRVRSTVLTTNDNIDIVVPNSEFVSGRVVNWTMREARRRIRIPFGVSYESDKAEVRRVILEAALKVPFTLNNGHHRPQVWLVGFGDSALNFELVVWLSPDAVKRPASVQAAYCWEIDTALRAYNIEIPFPQRDLHIKTMPIIED